MRSNLFVPVISLLFILTITACTRKMSVQSASKSDFENITQSKFQTDSLYTNEISSKIIRSFYRTYGELPGTKWYKSDNGFIVSFKNLGINRMVHYRNGGLVDCEILYYSESLMPKAVRHFVKSKFYDYSIAGVTEVRNKGVTAFYVKIENDYIIQTLRIIDEEYQFVESLIKR